MYVVGVYIYVYQKRVVADMYMVGTYIFISKENSYVYVYKP